MDDENRILTKDEFDKMNADLEKELAGRDYHGEMKDALEFAMNALNSVACEYFWDSHPCDVTAKRMNDKAQDSLKELKKRGYWK